MSARTGRPITEAHIRDRNKFGKTVLFDASSQSNLSAYFEVRDYPVVIQLYGAVDSQYITVLTVYGNSVREQPFLVNGQSVVLNAETNSVVLNISGRYRLELTGNLDNILCVYGPQMTGRVLNDLITPPSTAQAHRPNLFLDHGLLPSITHVIEIADEPWVFNAYGLEVGEYIEILSTFGWGSTYREEIYLVDNQPLRLTNTSNSLILEVSGRYRFQLVGDPSNIVLVGNPTKQIARAVGGSSLTSTDDLPEGITNLYFTDARAVNALETTGIDYLALYIATRDA